MKDTRMKDIRMKAGWGTGGVAFALALLLAFATTAARGAGDADAGKAKAKVCAACHGQQGISGNPLWPNLAGQQQAYLAKQIKAFRDGERSDPSMAPFMANLTDQDAEDIAAYYASLSRCR